MTVTKDLEWKDISEESYREYTFLNGVSYKIVNPIALNVSDSGGHRIYDDKGVSYYIPYIWIALKWEGKEKGEAQYAF